MKEQKEKLIMWLNNTHAMEKQIAETLEKHSGQTKELPEIQSKINEHIEATKKHAEIIEKCITNLGGELSKLREAGAKVMGNIMGISMSFSEDSSVLNTISDYATEHFEIATYTGLKAAAEQLDAQEVIDSCEQILEDEKAMAEWLKMKLPEIARAAFSS